MYLRLDFCWNRNVCFHTLTCLIGKIRCYLHTFYKHADVSRVYCFTAFECCGSAPEVSFPTLFCFFHIKLAPIYSLDSFITEQRKYLGDTGVFSKLGKFTDLTPILLLHFELNKFTKYFSVSVQEEDSGWKTSFLSSERY